MKASLLLASIFFTTLAIAAPKVENKSVYTDITKECVTIQASNDKSDIDFLETECKSFGGFTLKISGGDLRYGPELSFAGKEIELERPMGFHDTGSTKIEWMYQLTSDEDGTGSIKWTGLIYRLVVSDENGTDSSVLYSVRLDGEKSCLIGKSKDNAVARQLVLGSKADCK